MLVDSVDSSTQTILSWAGLVESVAHTGDGLARCDTGGSELIVRFLEEPIFKKL